MKTPLGRRQTVVLLRSAAQRGPATFLRQAAADCVGVGMTLWHIPKQPRLAQAMLRRADSSAGG